MQERKNKARKNKARKIKRVNLLPHLNRTLSPMLRNKNRKESPGKILRLAGSLAILRWMSRMTGSAAMTTALRSLELVESGGQGNLWTLNLAKVAKKGTLSGLHEGGVPLKLGLLPMFLAGYRQLRFYKTLKRAIHLLSWRLHKTHVIYQMMLDGRK